MLQTEKGALWKGSFGWINWWMPGLSWVWKMKLGSTGNCPSTLTAGTSRKIYNPTLRPFLLFLQLLPSFPTISLIYFPRSMRFVYFDIFTLTPGTVGGSLGTDADPFPAFAGEFFLIQLCCLHPHIMLVWAFWAFCLKKTCTSRHIQVNHYMTAFFSEAGRGKNHTGDRISTGIYPFFRGTL